MDDHIDIGILRTDNSTTPEITSDFNFAAPQLHNSRDSSLDVDPNGFIDILFDSPLELPFPSQTPSIFRQGYSEGGNIPPLENSLLHTFSTREFVSRSNIQLRAASKVQKSWPTSVQPTKRQNLWPEILSSSAVNIFDSLCASGYVSCTSGASVPFVEESFTFEVNLTDANKKRLRALKKKILICGCTDLFDDDMACDKGSLCKHTAEVFDQGFYLYTHKYQPAYPIAHLPTFNPEKVSDILLFTMCIIGVSLLKTEEAASFIRMTFPVR